MCRTLQLEIKMSPSLERRVRRITFDLMNLPNSKNKHFTFFVRHNTILSIGWNDYDQTHPMCFKHGYRYNAMHSEVSALIKFRGEREKLKRCTVINTRINRHGIFGMSKPCPICQKILSSIGIRKVWYTDYSGKFQKFYDLQ